MKRPETEMTVSNGKPGDGNSNAVCIHQGGGAVRWLTGNWGSKARAAGGEPLLYS